jgi:hypothetical protein
MKGNPPCQLDLDLFEQNLRQIIDTAHPLAVLADIFPWDKLEREYSVLYSETGAPSKPVRLMAGLLILKLIFDGSDQGIVNEWPRDPYFQYLCGGSIPVGKPPCSSSDLSRFRKRIGNERIVALRDLTAIYIQKSGIGRIRINGGLKPGNEGFSYSVDRLFLHKFLKGVGKVRETCRRLLYKRGIQNS